MADLAGSVQALPAELYNQIRDLTFTASSSEIVVGKDYKPPISLQVSSATRNQFAKSYYCTITFSIHEDHFHKYINSLPHSHVAYIRDIKVDVKQGPRDAYTPTLLRIQRDDMLCEAYWLWESRCKELWEERSKVFGVRAWWANVVRFRIRLLNEKLMWGSEVELDDDDFWKVWKTCV